MPTISCIIATRNRKNLVDRAIQSVLNQTYPCRQLIIIDDASSDNTFDYLKNTYNNQKIKILKNSTPLGPAATRNIGIEKAFGEYISFIDDDDEWLPEKIERQIILTYKGYEFVTMTRANYMISDRSKCQIYGPKLDKVRLKDLFRRNVIINVSPLIKTSFMKKVKFDENLWCGEDYDAWIRLLETGIKTINLNSPLVILHKANETTLNQNRKNKYYGRQQIYMKHKKQMTNSEKMWFIMLTILKLIIPDPRFIKNKYLPII